MFPLSPGHRCFLPSIGRHYNSKFYLSTALLYHSCFEMYADDPAFSDCQRHQVLGGLASMWPVRTSPISWCNSKTGHTKLWCEATLIENGDHSVTPIIALTRFSQATMCILVPAENADGSHSDSYLGHAETKIF